MKHLSGKILIASASLAFISMLVVAGFSYKKNNQFANTGYWELHSSQVQLFILILVAAGIFGLGIVIGARWYRARANQMHASLRSEPIFLHDSTAKKKNDETLRMINDRANIIAKITNDSIWDWDLITNQVVRYHTSLETLFGYEPFAPEEVDSKWAQLVHPEDWQRIKEKRGAIFGNTTENYWADEYRFKRSDGKWGHVSDKGFIIRNEAGKAIRMVGASRNISEIKNTETILKEKNTELKDLSTYLQHIREEERTLIALEVHEELGQTVSALKIDLDWLQLKIMPAGEAVEKRIMHANKITEQLIVAIRKMAADLRPSILDHFGLNAALQWYCDEFEKLQELHCSFTSTIDDTHLPVDVKTAIYRIVQESLSNVAKHAQAHKTVVLLTEDGDKLCLAVTDDGIGFDALSKKGTFGLVGLRERAISMNGELSIESGKGEGTSVMAMIPRLG
ncbi:MAG: PAS domain-containing protein [Bacteroidota bacterium]